MLVKQFKLDVVQTNTPGQTKNIDAIQNIITRIHILNWYNLLFLVYPFGLFFHVLIWYYLIQSNIQINPLYFSDMLRFVPDSKIWILSSLS